MLYCNYNKDHSILPLPQCLFYLAITTRITLNCHYHKDYFILALPQGSFYITAKYSYRQANSFKEKSIQYKIGMLILMPVNKLCEQVLRKECHFGNPFQERSTSVWKKSKGGGEFVLFLERGRGGPNSKYFEEPLFSLFGRFSRNIWEVD